jgi:hypothetical protein
MIRKPLSLLPAVAVLVLAEICAHPAAAQIRGTFLVTTKTNCIDTENGFNSSFEPNSGPVYATASSSATSDVFQPNGKGTVTGSGTDTAIPVPPGSFTAQDSHASAWDVKYSFTYSMNSSGVIAFTLVPGSYLQTFLTGPRAGQTATLDVLTYDGFLSRHSDTLLTAIDTTYVRIKTYSNGDVRQEVCNRSGTGVLQ